MSTRKIKLVKGCEVLIESAHSVDVFQAILPAGTILEFEDVEEEEKTFGTMAGCGEGPDGKRIFYDAKEEGERWKPKIDEQATITVEGDNVVISYLDTMTFAQAWQKLIVDAGIPHYVWANVKDFFPVNKNRMKIEEKVTGKRITEKAKNVLDLTPDMCSINANKSLESGKKFLSPVAYFYWFASLYKQGKYLDEGTWTIFPNWRNSARRALLLRWSPGGRRVYVSDWGPDFPAGDVGVRPAVG